MGAEMAASGGKWKGKGVIHPPKVAHTQSRFEGTDVQISVSVGMATAEEGYGKGKT